MLKLKISDPELEAATLEIYNEVKKQSKSKGEMELVEGQEGDDDDYETVSEESLSGDEKDDDAEMKDQ